MNRNLEILLKLFQQSKGLDDDAKKGFINAVRKVEEELDQKNRTLEIEAGLERVRGRAMSMHNSSDLSATASTVFVELRKLNIHPVRTGVTLLTLNSDAGMFYSGTSSRGVDELELVGKLDMMAHPVLKKQYEAWLKKENYFPELSEEEQDSYYAALLSQPAVPIKAKEIPRGRYGYYFPFAEGLFYAWTQTPFSESEISIISRFKSIIDLTFRRYLDLHKAEMQARESQIEAALERVRSKALAMQNVDDLAGAVAIVFDELEKLNLEMIRCGIGILKRDSHTADVWTTGITEPGKKVQVYGDESLDIHPLLQGAYNAWVNQQEFSYELKGDDFINYYRAIGNTNFHLPDAQSFIERAQKQFMQQFYFVAPFEAGNLFAFRDTEFPDEAKKIIKRFADVFNLTYTRFLDLQNAEAQAKEAQLERKRSEDLLLNILPQEIANELKQFGKSYARKHEEVTVMFADIQRFSSIAENLSADELVTQLDECFRAFDKIVEKHGLEKIKTVGDAYVCACGLPQPVVNHAAKTVAAALDMIEFIKGFGMTKKIQNLPAFEFRVGIHTGPVVTGVVGLKKFTYDIWGDAVNIAARMEQHGEPGKINVSGVTYRLIKDKYTCIHRGKIQAKNKGEIDMYFVNRSFSEG